MGKVAGAVAGILSITLGIACLMTPLMSFGVAGWIIACVMAVDGIAKLVVWRESRDAPPSDLWAHVAGVCSAVLSVTLAVCLALSVANDVFVAHLVACWVLLGGVLCIVRAAHTNEEHATDQVRPAEDIGGLVFVLGVLMVLAGLFGIANPLFVAVALTTQIGLAFVAGGVGLICSTL